MLLGAVMFTQPFAEGPYESCATTPQAVRPPNTTTTSTAAIAKMRFCRGVRRPALGLVLAYMEAQCKQHCVNSTVLASPQGAVKGRHRNW